MLFHFVAIVFHGGGIFAGSGPPRFENCKIVPVVDR
jgi:hypothetical protein